MKWINEWPVRWAILVLILNMELVVIPIILKGMLGLDGWYLKTAAMFWATGEIYFWYWFSGWLAVKMKNHQEVRDAIGIGKEAIPEVKNSISYRRADQWIRKNIIDRFDPNKYQKGRINLFLKGCGYIFGLPLFFILGLIPCLWVFGITATRIKNWRLGFWFLILGNMLKNIGFAEGWDHIWLL